MPGTASVAEAPGQPQAPGSADFTMVFVGPSALNPVTVGQLTPAYSNPAAAASDLGASDMCDGLMQAIAQTPGNPQPPPAYAYVTPATTPGSYGAVTTASMGASSSVPAAGPATPTGTFEPWMQVVTGFTVGVTGGTAYASLNGGRNKKLVNIGAKTYYAYPASDGWPCGGGQAEWTFGPATSTVAALYTSLNAGRTAVLAHLLIVSGSPAVHAAADTTDNATLTAVPVASTPATAVALFNALLALLLRHGSNTGGSYHTNADTVLAAALAAIPIAVTIEDCILNEASLRAAYEAHRILVGGSPVHGSADSTNTWAAYSTPTAVTLAAGATFSTNTLPPIWADADLYAAGPPATGAFAAIAESDVQMAVVVLTEPWIAGDFSTVVAGINYCNSFGKRILVLGRFRDPIYSGETDAAHLAAWEAFRVNFLDSRIACCAGSCWLTDAFSGAVYLRSFLPALCARWQSFAVVAGQEGEKLSQNAGWVARGPLEGASLKDTNGNTIGHDEAVRSGITATPGAATGGGIALYYQRIGKRKGTYVDNRSGVLYPVGSAVLLYEDRRIANAVEQLLTDIALETIGGADATSPLATPPVILDAPLVDALSMKMSAAVKAAYPDEFQNAEEPGLVVVNPVVTVVGGMVALSVTINARFWNFGDNVLLTFALTR